MPENAIGKSRVLQIPPGHVVKGARAVVGAHAIDLRHHKPKRRQRFHARGKTLGNKRALRPGIDVLNHRILLPGIEVQWPVDHSPYLRLSIAARSVKRLCRLPSGGLQLRIVRGIDSHLQASIGSAMQFHHRRQVEPRIGVDKVLSVRRVAQRVIRFGWSQRRQRSAVEVDFVAMYVVGIFVRIHAAGLEVNLAIDFVDAVDGTHHPIATR